MVCCCDPFEPLAPEEGMEDQKDILGDGKESMVESPKPEKAKDEILVSVTLPQGVASGQKIEVRSPDGTRTVDTVVPDGLLPGQTFLVKFPPPSEQAQRNGPSLVEALDNMLTPTPDEAREDATNPLVSTAVHPVAGSPIEATVTQVHVESRQDAITDHRRETPKPEQQSLSLVQSLEDFLTPKPDVPEKPTIEREAPKPKFVLVQVPPGLAAGSTIFVEIPGENRTVTAQIPPNVASFHVAYTPQPQPKAPPMQARAVMAARQQRGTHEKLLSVRVPPGTPPGTTLHVSVPDEPGRILAAQVPPGNVSKFHVSYVPSEHIAQRAGMLPPANAYRTVDGSTIPFGTTALGTVGAGAYSHLIDSANDINSYAYGTC